MGNLTTFQDFLVNQSAPISLTDFVINFLLAAFLSFLLSKLYSKYGKTLSNRNSFAANFLLITVTTLLIITVVKSSLALSLGLVGALSIVRFRAAIKEPEELAYIFLTISIGLGLGADQRAVVLTAFLFISGLIMLRSFREEKHDNHNLYLLVSADQNKKLSLEQIVNIIKKHCSVVKMRRFDRTDKIFEISFFVELNNFEELHSIENDLLYMDSTVRITFLDNEQKAD